MPSNPSTAPQEALPSYESATAQRIPAQSQDRQLAPDEQPDIPPFDPPPFSTSPITFAILPNSLLIEALPNTGSTYPVTRALYELTRPLDGHYQNTTIADIPPKTRLRADGSCQTIWENQLLYKIYQHIAIPRSLKVTAISAQNGKLIQGTILRRGSGFGRSWEARSHGEDWRSDNTLLYHAKQNKGVIEWKNAKGKLVAIETLAVARDVDALKLEILLPLKKQMLDMLVAIWVAKAWQDARIERLKKEEEDAKERKEEQRAHDVAEGKPHGKLHDMKEALGIGFPVNHVPRSGALFGGPPTIGDDGRIKWS